MHLKQLMKLINHGRNGRIKIVLNYYYVAAIIRRRKEEISAVMVYEAGKPWDEAVGDAAEGIDFIEYYARSMMDLADGKPVLDREGNITNISINQLVQALQSHLGTFHLQLWLVQL